MQRLTVWLWTGMVACALAVFLWDQVESVVINVDASGYPLFPICKKCGARGEALGFNCMRCEVSVAPPIE